MTPQFYTVHVGESSYRSVVKRRCISLLQLQYFMFREDHDAHFIPMVGVGKRGAYELVYSNLPRQHSFGTTLRFTGSVTADCRQ